MISSLTNNKFTKNPQNAEKMLLKIKCVYSSIGFIKKETANEIQKLLHSWQRRGFLRYGILAIKFLKGTLASLSDQAYETPRQITK